MHYLFIKCYALGIFLTLIACKSNQVQTDNPTQALKSQPTEPDRAEIINVDEPEKTPMRIIEPSSVNPDDCRLTIKVTEISDSIVGGTIVEIAERGFGFKDYINNGDSREFKLLEGIDGLKPGMLIQGTIRTIGNSRDNIYSLRGIEIIK